MTTIDKLIDQVVILKENSDYRVGDIVNHSGLRWLHSKDQILNNPKYEDTILKRHLLENEDNDFPKLLECVQKYNQEKKLPVPTKNEIVIHLRLGDVCIHKWFMQKDYVKCIKNIMKNNEINKITIVTCFAYQAWSKDSLKTLKTRVDHWEKVWKFTEDKQHTNE